MTSSRVDDRLDLLADEHRRGVLEFLRRGPRVHATVDELAEHLATRRDAGMARRDGDTERLRVVLVHLCLPKLADHGVVDWDRRREEVRYREDEVVESVLDALAEAPVTVGN